MLTHGAHGKLYPSARLHIATTKCLTPLGLSPTRRHPPAPPICQHFAKLRNPKGGPIVKIEHIEEGLREVRGMNSNRDAVGDRERVSYFSCPD